jgi:hypothetical protein
VFVCQKKITPLLITAFTLLLNPPTQLEGTFSLPVDLSVLASDISFPHLAMNEAGDAVSIWQFNNGTNSSIQAAALTSLNKNWSAPVIISEKGKEASNPSVAIGPGGYAVAVWASYDGVSSAIQTATYSPDGNWSTPLTLSSQGNRIPQTGVAIDGLGNAIAVWELDNHAGSTVQTAWLPFGGVWSAPANISSPGTVAIAPVLAISPNGFAAVAWEEFSNGNYAVVVSASQFGRSWSEPAILSPIGVNATEVAIAVDNKQRTAVVWKQGSGFDIHASLSSALGTWSAPAALSVPGFGGSSPQVSLYKNGQALVVWATVFSHKQVVQASTIREGCAPSAPIDLSAPGFAYETSIAVDPCDSAIVAWSQYNGVNSVVQCAVLPVNGVWSEPIDISNSGEDAIGSVIGIDAQGEAIVAWRKNISDSSCSIQASQDFKALPTIPTAPKKFAGRVVKGRFSDSNFCIHRLEWEPSADPAVVAYHLYRNNQLIAVIPAAGPFNFDDRFRNNRLQDIYRLTAVNAAELESNSLIVSLQ